MKNNSQPIGLLIKRIIFFTHLCCFMILISCTKKLERDEKEIMEVMESFCQSSVSSNYKEMYLSLSEINTKEIKQDQALKRWQEVDKEYKMTSCGPTDEIKVFPAGVAVVGFKYEELELKKDEKSSWHAFMYFIKENKKWKRTSDGLFQLAIKSDLDKLGTEKTLEKYLQIFKNHPYLFVLGHSLRSRALESKLDSVGKEINPLILEYSKVLIDKGFDKNSEILFFDAFENYVSGNESNDLDKLNKSLATFEKILSSTDDNNEFKKNIETNIKAVKEKIALINRNAASNITGNRADNKVEANQVNDSRAHDVIFKFGTDRYEVGIHRIIVGSSVIEKGVVTDFRVEDAEQQGKYVVYFDISVKNINGTPEKYLNHDDFILEDESGNSYSSQQTRDYIKGQIHHGKQGRGGISFWVYKGNIPKRLKYDTGYVLVNTDRTIFASGELDEFKDFFK